MWRAVNSHLSGVYQYFNLIFGSAAFPPSQPSDATLVRGKALLQVLESRQRRTTDQQASLQHARDILQECTELDTLLQVTNEEGYNLLQVAVLADDRDFIKLLVTEGCNLNHGKCSLPLHLACHMGNLALVHFLIQQGANPNMEIGMCYPRPHIPVQHVPSRFHFLETDIYSCDRDHQLPVMYAIQQDHVDVVRCLMEGNEQLAQYPYHRQPLHMAAKHGALRSLQYLVSVRGREINDTDEEGMTPLHHAVQWGKALVQFLVESGADIHQRTNRKHNALHLLYMNIHDPMHLQETTRFLLGSGLEQDINNVDQNANTPLHLVVSSVNRVLASLAGGSQADFDSQVVDTIELLLRNNCDPNVVNSSGVTALHKLLLMFDFVISNNPTGITLETLPVREMFKTDFDILHRTLGTFLRHGTQPNAMTGAGRTPLVMLLQTVLNVDPAKLHQYTAGFLQCVSLLCVHGAHPSYSHPTHIAVISAIAHFGKKCLRQRSEPVKETMSNFLKELLTLLLRHGLNCNHCSLLRKREVEGSSGNLLAELVKLAQFIRAASDLLYIHDWVLTSLQWGADPDAEPYPSDPIICHSQSSIFLKSKGTQPVNQYMYEIQDYAQIYEGGYAEKLLMLFYNSMDHAALFHCFTSAKFMARFDPHRSPSSRFIRLINNVSSRPRSLRQISRVAIYKALDRQLNPRVNDLPLPPALKRYLVNVECD